MADSPERELLSQSAARQLLERAGQIELESTTVDTLRQAAREAGISEAAFEAALSEMRGQVATQPPVNVAGSRRRLLTGIGFGVGLMVVLMAVFVIPRAVAPVRLPIQSSETLVKCLPMETAADIARGTLGPASRVTVSPGSRFLRFEGTPEDMARLTAALNEASKTAPSCDASSGR